MIATSTRSGTHFYTLKFKIYSTPTALSMKIQIIIVAIWLSLAKIDYIDLHLNRLIAQIVYFNNCKIANSSFKKEKLNL